MTTPDRCADCDSQLCGYRYERDGLRFCNAGCAVYFNHKARVRLADVVLAEVTHGRL